MESEKQEKLERERREQEEYRLADALPSPRGWRKPTATFETRAHGIEGERRQQTRNVALVGNIHSDRIQSQIRRRVSQRVPRKGRMQSF